MKHFLLQFFSPPSDPALIYYGTHHAGLVTLSVLVAVFSSWMGLQMTAYGRSQDKLSAALRIITWLSGSVAFGCGMWAMHFIGMLAFDLCTSIEYDRSMTLLSLLPAVAASFVAMSVIGRRKASPAALLAGGALVGCGIGAMHYTGMQAMRTGMALQYDPWLFLLSLAVAVALATLALWIRFRLRGVRGHIGPRMRNLIAATVMGCAMAGMHYTGMTAARFIGPLPSSAAGPASTTFLALAVTLITVALTILVASANGWLRYRELFRHLSQSESWMRSLLTTTIDGVVTIDKQGIVQEFNASAERIFGWRRDEIVGRHVKLMLADVERSEREGLLHLLNTGDMNLIGKSNEVMAVRKDGTPIPIRRALGHARLADTDLFVLFITDISKRRAIELALRESEQQFRSLIGNIPGIAFRCTTAENQPIL
ncbi:MHYT domain-containing protein, partial [Janthinobacterium agaricidamnosum]